MRSGQNYEIIGGRSKKTMKARKAWLWLLLLLRKPIPPSTTINSLDPSPKLFLVSCPTMSRISGAVIVFGRSRLDYGHFHGRLLLRRPLPPPTAKNSLDRSARLILRFGPRPCLTCVSRPACLGIWAPPSWRTSCRLGEALS